MQPIRFRILALLAGLFTFAILPSAASAGDWGAIALSTARAVGAPPTTTRMRTKLVERAMRECRKNARDCNLFKTFENTCVAVAGDSTGNFGWSWGYTNSDAAGARSPSAASRAAKGCKVESSSAPATPIERVLATASNGRAEGARAVIRLRRSHD